MKNHNQAKVLCCALYLFGLCIFGPSLSANAGNQTPRIAIQLVDWRFQLNEEQSSLAATTFDDSAWETVTVPHTWNAFDGEMGEKGYFRGTGWYRTNFSLPIGAAQKRVLLEFDAVSRIAEVFVNGRLLGTHIGGFARFRFDATDAVKYSGDNLVTVRVNNATNDFIPRNGDFTMFGGIYRPARVLLTSAAHIATLDHASPGVFLTVQDISTNSAEVKARIQMANDGAEIFSGSVRVTVNSPDGNAVALATGDVDIAANGIGKTNLSLHILQPHLWAGVTDPFVYQTTIELLDANGKPVDSVVQPLGLRSFTVKPDAGCFLNGNPISLHGVNRHQDWPDKGWAIGTNEMAEDFGILQELGANTVRLCHYQHDQFFYDLCDHGGMAVWAELCFVNDPPFTQAGRENVKEQLRELIRQNFNHPSIFFWSIGNETRESATNCAADRLLAELATIVHEEDPRRLSTYASDHPLDDPRNFHADILGVNKYYGWYEGKYAEFGKFLDTFHKQNPRLPLGVSEYGAGASIYQHEQDSVLHKGQALSPWHPEGLQAQFHEEYWRQIKARPWLWGTYIWNLFDFASAGRDEGDTRGRNDKGLVTTDRQTRKDAFYWYQANWTTKPMVHIVSKRYSDRTTAQTEIKIYSNADEVEAKLNGVTLGRKSSIDCRFIWSEVELKPGVNRIEAGAWRDEKLVSTDSCSWNYQIDPILRGPATARPVPPPNP